MPTPCCSMTEQQHSEDTTGSLLQDVPSPSAPVSARARMKLLRRRRVPVPPERSSATSTPSRYDHPHHVGAGVSRTGCYGGSANTALVSRPQQRRRQTEKQTAEASHVRVPRVMRDVQLPLASMSIAKDQQISDDDDDEPNKRTRRWPKQVLPLLASLGFVRNNSSAAPRTSTLSSSKTATTTKEDVGRATWLLLHTLAAQLPEDGLSKQQRRDVNTLVDVLTRIYPCGDCARHFGELVRNDPPEVSSGYEFSQWLCRAHNAVNERLDKPQFSCDRIAQRWGKLDCAGAGCSLDDRNERANER